MPFNFYHKERLIRRIKELKELRYRKRLKLSSFSLTADSGEIAQAFKILIGDTL
jgi:hypothetical protein